MFKRLVAVILTLVVVLGAMGKPAYAYSGEILLMNLEGSNTGKLSEMSFPNAESALDTFKNWFLKPAVEGVVGFGAGVAVCIAADAAASAIFPPAAVLLPYCPAVGGAFGGGVAAEEMAFKGIEVIGGKMLTKLAQ